MPLRLRRERGHDDDRRMGGCDDEDEGRTTPANCEICGICDCREIFREYGTVRVGGAARRACRTTRTARSRRATAASSTPSGALHADPDYSCDYTIMIIIIIKIAAASVIIVVMNADYHHHPKG